jgi:hypothetical protein
MQSYEPPFGTHVLQEYPDVGSGVRNRKRPSRSVLINLHTASDTNTIN